MWPFGSRGSRADVSQANAGHVAVIDYVALERNDACLKVWLPKKVSDALDQLSAAHDSSKPDILRWLLFEYVYGRQEFENLIAWKERRDAESRGELDDGATRIRFSPKLSGQIKSPPRIASIEFLGKSTEDIKLLLPRLLKDELVMLADNERMGASDHIRKILVRVLLGEKVHQQWRAAVGSVPDDIRLAEADN